LSEDDALEQLVNLISKSRNKELKRLFNLHMQEYLNFLNEYAILLVFLESIGFDKIMLSLPEVSEESKFDNEFIMVKKDAKE